jgi:hypothetical protein
MLQHNSPQYLSYIKRWSVLLVEENIVPTVSHWQMLLNKCVGAFVVVSVW